MENITKGVTVFESGNCYRIYYESDSDIVGVVAAVRCAVENGFSEVVVLRVPAGDTNGKA